MTKKMISWLSILTVFLTLLWSCHNEDFANNGAEPQRNNANFFKHKSSVAAKSGVDYVSILEAFNREKDFLSTMPDQKGMPIWDKMQVVDAENTTGLMIPLSYDNKTMSSVLFATLDDENTVMGVKDYDNTLLENIVYDNKIDAVFREKIFYTFMYMDNRTFGTEEFTHVPKDLFKGKKRNEQYGRIKFTDFTISPKGIASESKISIEIEVCANNWHCTHHGTGPCDLCSACFTSTCSTTVIWIDSTYPSPSGMPGSSGGGGGGGATPSPEGTPPVDPCSQSGMPFYRVSPQCAGNNNGGNITDEELLPPKSPCETLQQMIEDDSIKVAIDVLKPKTLVDGIEFTQEISRVFNGTNGTYKFSANLREGGPFGANAATGGFIKGNAHSHPKDGVRIPSVNDIQWLNTCQLAVTPSYVVTYNIIVCANHLSPNDSSTANLYAIATDDKDILNTKIQDLLNRSDLAGKSDEDKKKTLMEDDDIYYDGLNSNPTELEKKFLQKYGNFGLSLYRFNKTINKWMKLTTDGNTITETPCE